MTILAGGVAGGVASTIIGPIATHAADGHRRLAVRHEQITLAPPLDGTEPAGTVVDVEDFGDTALASVRLAAGGATVLARHVGPEAPPAVGTPVALRVTGPAHALAAP